MMVWIASNWQLLSIPVIAALVGWLTNRLAIHMTFYPIEYVGKKPFGWQGIIPSKAHKMSDKAVDLITTKLLDIDELFAKLDADQLSEEMRPQLKELSRSIINKAMISEFPMIWGLLPKSQRKTIYADAEKQFPATISKVLEELKANLYDLLDVKLMMIEALTRQPEMLNRIFLRCGEKEFKFIERSGLYFGFIFGVIQMFIWNYVQTWWILPLGGLVVGYLTNWLALKLIFRPIHPVKIGPLVIQGLFMKRQNEVATEYSRILAAELLTFKQIFEFVLKNKGVDALADLAQSHVKEMVDETVGITRKTVIKLAAGSAGYERIREIAAEKFIEALPHSFTGVFDYTDRALAIGPTLESPPPPPPHPEFEDVLHPVFQEDELILIIVGAVLGAIAGFLQMMVMFAV